jgi:hypothetical protein
MDLYKLVFVASFAIVALKYYGAITQSAGARQEHSQ